MNSVKVILFVLFFTVTAAFVSAQTTFTASNGNWNVPGNWSNGIPDANTDAIIDLGATCTVNIPNAVCKSLTLTGGKGETQVLVSSGASLSVTNSTLVSPPTSGSRTNGVFVSGAYSTGSYTMNASNNNNRDCELGIDGGTVTITGNLTMNGTPTRNAVNFTAGGTLRIAGVLSGGSVIAGTGTVEFNNSGSQSIPAYTYNNIIISGSGTKSLSGALSVNGLNISAGDLSIGANTLTVNGTISGSGTITGSSASSMVVTSANSLSMTQSSSSTRTLNNLTFNATGTLTIANPLEITGTLTPTAGTISSGGNITLVSTASAEARVATAGLGASVTGNVVVQKYIPAGNGRRWLHLGAPIQNFTWSQLIDDILISGPGAGGFDVNGSNYPSAYTYEEYYTGDCGPNGWEYPTAVSNTPASNHGLKVFFRGDRNPSRLSYSGPAPNAVTLDFIGQINAGTQAMAVSYTNNGNDPWDGWNFVSNPYPSAIDWNAASGWTKTRISGTIYVWNAQSGTYATWNGNSGTNGMNSGRIAMGQGFWVKATATNPVLSMNENVKTATSISGFFKANQTAQNTFRITMQQDELIWDDAVFNFSNEYDRTYQKETGDALKLVNSTINLWSVSSDNQNLVINNYPAPAGSDTVVLGMTSSNGGIFTLKFSTDSIPSNMLVYLIDEYRGRTIDVRKEKEWKVLINAEPQSYALGRLKVVFVNVNPAQVSFNPTADEATKQTKVEWSSSKEIYTRKYEVQYSTDSINFSTIQTVQLNDTLLLQGCSYFFMHSNPVSGANYYRLAKYNMYGEVELTDIKKVVFNSVNTGIATGKFFNYTLYPVPAQTEMYFTSTKENVSNVSAVEIMNVNGQQIPQVKYQKQDNVITFDVSELPQGTYLLSITTFDGKKSSMKFQKNK
ncbi:MAG TPA: T9SS type A sorting domain-containing protein [Bacteroidia bacterium]|nr:T9SS type A sorting domain-containing protein [Bacteroidia bacterium]